MGKGDSGAVLKCNLVDYHEDNQKEVALKFIWNDFQVPTLELTEAFKSEWELVRGYLKPHQNIIRILKVFNAKIPQKIKDIFKERDFDSHSAKFIIMEFHPHTLKKFLKQSLPLLERLRLCQELSKGLFYLFQNHVIHGDMKLDNILISKEGTLVITDFGTAFCAETHDFLAERRAGNLAHLAPEIVNTPLKHSVSFKKQPSWELGVLCYEIIHFCVEKDSVIHPFGDYPRQFAKGKVSVKEYEVKFSQQGLDPNFVSLVKSMLQDFDTRIPLPEAHSALDSMTFLESRPNPEVPQTTASSWEPINTNST